MTKPADDEAAHVRTRLEESGILLELQVKAAFAKAGANVAHSRYYTDAIEGKLRETDVVASFHTSGQGQPGFVHVVYVVECKRPSGAHWALSQEPSPFRSDNGILGSLVHRGDLFAELGDVQDVHESPLLWSLGDTAATVTDLKESSSKGPSGSGTQAFSALQAVLSACDGLREVSFGPAPSVTLFVPVVVTTAKLWAVRLSAGGDLEVSATNRMLLVEQLRPDRDLSSVWVVSADAVVQFAADAARGINRLRLVADELPQRAVEAERAKSTEFIF